jgi:hypothetical protein
MQQGPLTRPALGGPALRPHAERLARGHDRFGSVAFPRCGPHSERVTRDECACRMPRSQCRLAGSETNATKPSGILATSTARAAVGHGRAGSFAHAPVESSPCDGAAWYTSTGYISVPPARRMCADDTGAPSLRSREQCEARVPARAPPERSVTHFATHSGPPSNLNTTVPSVPAATRGTAPLPRAHAQLASGRTGRVRRRSPREDRRRLATQASALPLHGCRRPVEANRRVP